MRAAIRGLTALAGAGVLSLVGITAPALAASTSSKHSVNACDQKVARGHYTCYAMRRTDVVARTSLAPNVTPSGYGPASLQSAYALPSSSAGTGQTLYVVDAFDDPNAESDLATYRAQYGLAACTTANGCFKKVNQNGAATPLPAGDTGWAGEISLDLDMVSAICPNCHITLVEANDATDNLFTAVKRATTMGAKFVSMSWGGPEGGTESTYDSTYFNTTGVVYTASTGDDGYSAGVIYPATSTKVVAVGGTSLTTATNTRGWSETAWSGAGSGCSSDEAKPTWQGVVSACTKRAIADVSANADPNTGVAVYQTYGGSGWSVYGGTSEAAPIIASVYALAGPAGASDNPAAYPYAHTANLYDVTSGSTGSCSPAALCKGAVGWDGPTGLGTPNGVAAFKATSTVTVTNPGSRTGTVGTVVTPLQLAATGGNAPYTWSATGLPAGLSISTAGLISGTPTTAAPYSVTATAKDSASHSGSATFSWTISPVATGCSGQLFGNPGFESGSTGWTATAGVIGQNGPSEPAHAGTWDAWLDGYGTTHTDSVTRSVAIPAGCHATLTFYLHIDTAETTTTTAYDTLKVTAGSTTEASYSNLNHATGYALRTIDLSAFAGTTVAVKFTGTEDVSLQTSFVLDDTGLTLS